MTNREIWEVVLGAFENSVSQAHFRTWFRNTGISRYENGEVEICVPNTFTKTWLERKYHSGIIKAIEKATGKPIKKANYKVGNIDKIETQEVIPNTKNSASSNKESVSSSPQLTKKMAPESTASKMFNQQRQYGQPYQEQLKATPGAHYGLNDKYTFETFIVGKQNELAHAAAQAVANRPGEAYNPLFIYGGVGLGKTHLLQAIAHKMLVDNEKTKILYVSSEKFTNEFVASVKEGRAKEFKDRYRKVDLLLIDDIQFIAGKEQTQEEFFHTFNELHQQGKQVVLTSDRPPKAIPALEDRLRSRFEWGMIADVAAPDLETRVAILQSKSQEKSFGLSEDLIQMIAETIQSNIRELEGALNKVIAYHELKGIDPNEESVKSIISSFEGKTLKKTITPRELIVIVSKFYDISIEDVKGKSREKRLSFPRQIIMYLMRESLKLSYPAIGQELGGRDHTTAMHAYKKISKKLKDSAKLREEIDLIKQRAQSTNIS